jgi:hypothetical protein
VLSSAIYLERNIASRVSTRTLPAQTSETLNFIIEYFLEVSQDSFFFHGVSAARPLAAQRLPLRIRSYAHVALIKHEVLYRKTICFV